MSYKTILAVLDDPKSAAQITEIAISFAATFDAHLIGVHSEAMAMIPLSAPMEMPDPTTVQAMQDMAHDETRKIEQIFRNRCVANGTSHDWRSFLTSAGYGSGALQDSARCADLIIAAQTDSSLADSRADLDGFLFESGRPVLLVPYILTEPKPIKRAMVAWNGSREAARATFDALPLLKKADAVEIFSVNPPDNQTQSAETAGAEIAATLARHGVHITVVTQEADGVPAATVIENRLSDSSIDLLVMGAFGHKRWWETLFGGVTHTLLDSMTALTLLSR
ncbi:universal stress protein [Rhizobium halophytocola]|uniref:Nucleotide-binding universal stress UspA family protein n=1 Tax=Rhizobium halophytocola TaxID=735519 RepID=A0ABS4DVT6_9HYPH|nr:universal stress protein [Rhizobium halophytocola]MBP1849810.1 nucleotide-binding universal stress UspA family protein [Rhizobium halophytocola]